MSDDVRIEHDLLGDVAVPAGACTASTRSARSRTSRSPAGPSTRSSSHAYGAVKLACARTNRALGVWAGLRPTPRPPPSSAPAAR